MLEISFFFFFLISFYVQFFKSLIFLILFESTNILQHTFNKKFQQMWIIFLYKKNAYVQFFRDFFYKM